jgi:hypothetical protein
MYVIYSTSQSSMFSLHPIELEFESLEECDEGGGLFGGKSAICPGSVCCRCYCKSIRTPVQLTVRFKVPT